MAQRYWLMKSEPTMFSFENLKKSPHQTTFWDGVRNYQARNFLRDQVKKGDGVLFYHSNVEPMAIMGTAKVVQEGYPDHTQFDPKSNHYDSDSSPANPRWYMVDICMDEEFKSPVSLNVLKKTKGLEGMELLRKGTRLSIQPVTEKEWNIILKLGLGSVKK